MEEIELDDDVVELLQYWAEREGRTLEEQASVMIREALDEIANTATSDEPTPPPGEIPTA